MSFVKAIIGVMVAVLIGVTAVIPVVNTTITNLTTPANENVTANITGTTATVLQIIPIMLGIAVLLGVVALFS